MEAAAWYRGYIETASAYGIVKGYSDAAFGPNDKITREQAMTMISRAMKITGLDASLSDNDVSALLKGFTDAGNVSPYAKSGIAACLKTGIILGKSASTLAPLDYITRAEVAAVAERLLQKSNLI